MSSNSHSSRPFFISARSASEPIYDLDWTSTPDNQSILAVGFAHHVELLCQQRKTYFGDDPAWTICFKIEVGRFVFPRVNWVGFDSALSGTSPTQSVIRFGSPMVLYWWGLDIICFYMARLSLMDPVPQMKACSCMLPGSMVLFRIIILKCYCNVFYGVHTFH